MNAVRWLVICFLSLSAATCGNKGPLTLPEGEPRVPASLIEA